MRQTLQRGPVARSQAKPAPKAAKCLSKLDKGNHRPKSVDRLEPLPACVVDWPLGREKRRRQKIAAALLPKLLKQMEAPPVDDATRDRLVTFLYRAGSEGLTAVVRAIVETGPDCANARAFREPVISAVHSVALRRPDWFQKRLPELLAAVDQLPPLMMLVDVMRGLDLFREDSLPRYLAMVIENKLRPILDADQLSPREAARQRREQERALIADARRRRNERAAENNPALMALYGSRPEVLHRASHTALEALASRPLPAAVRAKFERMIIAGERVTGRAVEAAYRATRPATKRRPRR